MQGRKTLLSWCLPRKPAFRGIVLLGLAGAVSCGSLSAPNEASVRAALHASTGTVQLPAGDILISKSLVIPPGARDLKIGGAPGGTVLRASPDFQGRAVIVSARGARIEFRNFAIEGDPAAVPESLSLPPSDVAFADFYMQNGLLIEDAESVSVIDVRFRRIPSFPVLVSRSSGVRIERVRIEDSGSTNPLGRNNSTGGILLEEGCSRFEVLQCVLRNVKGNGIWTHSRYESPRNRDGRIAENQFFELARDAVQVGHATRIRVENNSGRRIGYPVAEVDAEGGAIPVAIDTAGNTDLSSYATNRFEEINGKCIDLDGFHHGEVRDNSCVNRLAAEDYPHGHYGIVFNNANPDMQSEEIRIVGNTIDGAKYGGIFVIGHNHTISGNTLRNLNLAHCNESGEKFGCYYRPEEPDLLQAGIYLGQGAERPAVARGVLVEDNDISGFQMSARCVMTAPRVSAAENQIRGNRCRSGTVSLGQEGQE